MISGPLTFNSDLSPLVAGQMMEDWKWTRVKYNSRRKLVKVRMELSIRLLLRI